MRTAISRFCIPNPREEGTTPARQRYPASCHEAVRTSPAKPTGVLPSYAIHHHPKSVSYGSSYGKHFFCKYRSKDRIWSDLAFTCFILIFVFYREICIENDKSLLHIVCICIFFRAHYGEHVSVPPHPPTPLTHPTTHPHGCKCRANPQRIKNHAKRLVSNRHQDCNYWVKVG